MIDHGELRRLAEAATAWDHAHDLVLYEEVGENSYLSCPLCEDCTHARAKLLFEAGKPEVVLGLLDEIDSLRAVFYAADAHADRNATGGTYDILTAALYAYKKENP